jgi:hypothetical protein
VRPAPPTTTTRRNRIDWRDETGQRRLQAAGKSGCGGCQYEGGRAHRHWTDSDAARRSRSRGIGLHRQTNGASRQIIKQHKRNQTQAACQQSGAAGAERCRNSDQPAGAAGQIAPFNRDGFDDKAERNRHHGKIWTGDAKRGDRERSRNRGHQKHRERQRLPEIQAGLGGEDAESIGAERHESTLT